MTHAHICISAHTKTQTHNALHTHTHTPAALQSVQMSELSMLVIVLTFKPCNDYCSVFLLNIISSVLDTHTCIQSPSSPQTHTLLPILLSTSGQELPRTNAVDLHLVPWFPTPQPRMAQRQEQLSHTINSNYISVQQGFLIVYIAEPRACRFLLHLA